MKRLAERGCGRCRGRSRRTRFDGALAAGAYDDPLRAACLRFKHARYAWLAGPLAEMWLERHEKALAEWVARSEREPLLVPIRPHWLRAWFRPHDHATALARVLKRRTRLPLCCGALRRVRYTPRLARRSPTERHRNLRGAFAGRARLVRDRDIILVDDIMTTCATCNAAARALKRAGAKRVLAVVIARAEGFS
jgi:predicted amidophosphoribosyltransferase